MNEKDTFATSTVSTNLNGPSNKFIEMTIANWTFLLTKNLNLDGLEGEKCYWQDKSLPIKTYAKK